MSSLLARRAVAGAPLFSASLLILVPALACAQEALPSLEIGAATVVSADRVEEPAARATSAVSVISSKEIEKRGATGLLEVLRGAPGLDFYSSGGVGTTSYVYLRGAAPGQTLVLIDGVRIGDPSATDGAVDFGALVATDIERIEVLRGPQSALYGSDAMGGVIDIITRKGEGKPKGSVLLEGGSFGTIHTRATLSGSEGPLWYAFAVDALHVGGHPRFGYRITRPLTIGDGVTPLPPLPVDDPTNKGGASARLGYRFSEELSVEAAFTGYDNAFRFDNPFAFAPADVFDRENHAHSSFGQGYVRIDADLFDRRLHNRLMLFGNVIDRDIWQANACFDASFTSFDCRSGFRGERRGLEYQGDLKLESLGLLTFGAREETETVHTSQDPAPAGSFTPIDATQTTHSGFAQHKLTLLDRFDLSYGGRIDAVEANHTFGTWRATAAYRLEETGTKLRASAGTGARVASLYQRFSQYGDPRLKPETSLGYDVGFDQTLFGDRLFASVSLFENDFRELIEYGSAPTCTATQPFGCYFNVGKAKTRGVEFSGEAALVPGEWRLKASYTHLAAEDVERNLGLLRRPRDKGMAALVYSGFPGLELEARLNVVGPRPDYDFITSRRVVDATYARLDLFADYKVNELFSVFARIENINDARYEEIYNYGTAGRSAYGGVRLKW
ncbi:TonB-dependent siderophore receptor [Methylosinus sp. Sm6]|uniref:TonB-dependent receptor plug domain-containing protein n=1 Tax=Methylosinus sp. Sm6 TaxID=2866948 RepID=UPI001C99FA22|nr:TonB-dependent receptor [Methylosinus sp. Sm6]MBY6242071.1 TonB-dependent receptor [Methylosinus sp. Sm6]